MLRPQNLILLMFLMFSLLNGQKNNDFSSLVDKSVQKIYQNPDEAINFIQSFIISEQNPEHRLVLQNLMAQAYAMKGDYVQSVRMSLDKENNILHQSNQDFANLIRDYALAEQYQNLKLYTQSSKLISELLKDQSLYKSDENYNITIAKIYQLQAINFSVNKKTDEALSSFQKSDTYLKSQTAENFIIKTENDLLQASIDLNRKQIGKAKTVLFATKQVVDNKSEQVFLYSLTYERLARLSFLDKNYSEAISLLEKALANVEGVDYLVLKSRIYDQMAKSYLALQNEDKYRFYEKLFVDSKAKIDASQKEGIRYLLKLTELREQQSLEQGRKDASFLTRFLLIGFAVAVAGLAIYYFFEYKRKEELAKQLDFFKNQKSYFKKLSDAKEDLSKSALEPQIEDDNNLQESEVKQPKKSILISKEKEDEILQKLDDLEKSDRFLNKEMSLAVLAGQLETNTKYLSEIINKYKGKNFNLYINELRVNYIAYMLKTNPIYLNYKVSYLAEVSGFSSHSAFTTVFKSITGMSPNAYIQQINQSNK